MNKYRDRITEADVIETLTDEGIELKVAIEMAKILATKDDIHDVRNEIHDVRNEVRDVRNEVRDVRNEIQDVRDEIHTLSNKIDAISKRDFRLLVSIIVVIVGAMVTALIRLLF